MIRKNVQHMLIKQGIRHMRSRMESEICRVANYDMFTGQHEGAKSPRHRQEQPQSSPSLNWEEMLQRAKDLSVQGKAHAVRGAEIASHVTRQVISDIKAGNFATDRTQNDACNCTCAQRRNAPVRQKDMAPVEENVVQPLSEPLAAKLDEETREALMTFTK